MNKARAVGALTAGTPLSIVVPCHRVIGTSGSLTGFAGGVATKHWLPGFERRHAAGRTVEGVTGPRQPARAVALASAWRGRMSSACSPANVRLHHLQRLSAGVRVPDAEAAVAVGPRRWNGPALRTPATANGSTGGWPANGTAGRPPPPHRGSSAQILLVVLGAGLLILAGLVFVAVAWDLIGAYGQLAMMLLVTVLTGGVAVHEPGTPRTRAGPAVVSLRTCGHPCHGSPVVGPGTRPVEQTAAAVLADHVRALMAAGLGLGRAIRPAGVVRLSAGCWPFRAGSRLRCRRRLGGQRSPRDDIGRGRVSSLSHAPCSPSNRGQRPWSALH